MEQIGTPKALYQDPHFMCNTEDIFQLLPVKLAYAEDVLPIKSIINMVCRHISYKFVRSRHLCPLCIRSARLNEFSLATRKREFPHNCVQTYLLTIPTIYFS